MSFLRKNWQYFAIFLIGIAVYFDTFDNPFVWLDKIYVLYNTSVHTINLTTLFKTSVGAGHYSPLTSVYWAILYTLFGANPVPYNVIQILLHIACVSLVFYFFKRFIDPTLAFFLSLIFLVHPMNVSATQLVSAVGILLVFFFGMIAVIIASHTRENRTWKHHVLISFFLLLSLLSKEEGVIFFLVIVGFQFFYNRKEFIRGIPFKIGVVLFYILLRFGYASVVYRTDALVPISRLTFLQRLANIPQILMFYIGTFFNPTKVVIDQQWAATKFTFDNFFLPLSYVVLFGILLYFVGELIKLKTKENFTLYLFFLSIFSLGLLVHLQLIPLDYTVANRWFYFSMFGILGIVGLGLNTIHLKVKKASLLGLGIFICVFLSATTMKRAEAWDNEIALFSQDATTADNFDIEANLSAALYAKGDIQGAIAHGHKSVEMFPYDLNLMNLGSLYEQAGNAEKAKEYYEKAAFADNYAPGDHDKLLYRVVGRFLIINDPVLAEKVIKQGIKEYPVSPRLHALLAILTYSKGDVSTALGLLAKAYEQSSDKSTKNTIQNLFSDMRARELVNIKDELVY